MPVYIIIILIYFFLVIGISVITRKLASKSSSDFLVAGRNLGTIFCGFVVAAEWLGGMSTIGVSEKAFTTGTFQPVLYNISTAAGMMLLGFTLAYFYRKNNVHTVSEALEKLFGIKAKKYSAIGFLIAYITLAYVQLQACASIIAPLFGIDWVYAVLLGSTIITIYTYLGGMHAISFISILNIVIKFTGLGTAVFLGLKAIGGIGELQSLLVKNGSPDNLFNPFSAGVQDGISLLIGGLLGGMAAQASIQPIFAAKDAATARKAAILSAFIVAPFGMMTALLGLMAKSGFFIDPSTITNPKEVLTTLLTSPDFIPPVFGGLAVAGVLAAIFSTVGPVNFAVVTIVTKDIYHGFLNPQASDKQLVRFARKMVIGVSILTVPLAITIKGGVLDAAYVSYAIRGIGAIVIIFGVYLKGWIDEITVKYIFIYGTFSVFIFIFLNNLGIITIDKNLGSAGLALMIILISKILKRKKTI